MLESVSLALSNHVILYAASLSLVGFIFVSCIRQLYFHPLSHIPGPKLAALSNYSYSRSYLGGKQPWDILRLHSTYGPVVRVAPNEVSFNSSQSWQDIYTARKSNPELIKSSFYDGGNFADQAHSIVSERDPAKHFQMRRFLSRAFSDQSLREQEHLITSLIDEFVDKVGSVSAAQSTVDLTNWFNLLTFDIIGMLAFGRDFRGIRSGETHTMIQDVLGSMMQASMADTIKRFPRAGRLFMMLRPGWLAGLIKGAIRHQSYVIKLTNSRVAEETDRKDFMSYLLTNREGVSDIQLAAHASDFVIAGSETTATTLGAVMYYLCKERAILERLEAEVLSAFPDPSAINATSAATLKYLHAICLEALRIFPPLPLGLPRETPVGGTRIDGTYVPDNTIVSTNPLAASCSSANFANPSKFDPERWLGANTKDILEASKPFSLGSRSCLGRSLAWLELNLTLTKLVRKYKFELVGDVDWQKQSEMHLLWKKPALHVRLTPR